MADKSLRWLLFGEDVSASKSIEGVGKASEGTAKRIGAAFSQVGGKIGGEFGDILDHIGSGLESISSGGKAAKIAAAGGAVSGLGAALQVAASGDQQAADQLSQAIVDSGNSAKDFGEDIEKTIHQQENFAHSAQDTQDALRVLTQSTGDPKKAISEMGLVANLAAAQHISLADASGIVAKVLAGKGGKALAAYGIVMKKNKDGTMDAQGALDQLSKKIDGQAAASMDNIGAKVNVVKTKLGDMVAVVGGKLGPALTAVGPVLAIASTAMQLMAARNAAAAVASEAATAATTEQAVATEAATVAEDGLNVSLLANPIGLIVLAIIALIAIFVVAYKKVGWFRAAVDAAFAGIKVAIGWISTAVGAVISFVKSHWDLIFAILTGPIGLAVKWVVQHWSTITAVFEAIVSKIGPIIGKVKDVLIFPFKTAFNAIATLWNNTVGRISFSLPSWIPGLGGKGFSMPKIPLMAAGGIVTRPTLIMAGEAGAEAIVPLTGSRGRAALGGGGLTIYITQPLGTPDQIARAVGGYLDDAIRRGTYRPSFAR